MEIAEAVTLTQARLAAEGSTLADLLRHFRGRFSPALIGEIEWEQLLKYAEKLPIVMGAHPVGFEIPLQARIPKADLCVALASGTHSAKNFLTQVQTGGCNQVAQAVSLLLAQIEADDSRLREIVGRKMMLQFRTTETCNGGLPLPDIFLRADRKPILGATSREQDVCIVANALATSLGRSMTTTQLDRLTQVYRVQPDGTRMDSFTIFPAESQAIQLSVLGFKTRQAILSFLTSTAWSGQRSVVDSIITRFAKRMQIANTGLNILVGEAAVEPILGLTFIVKQRQTKDSRYWLGGLTEWNPVLTALGQEQTIIPEKLQALESWLSKPMRLFASSGAYILLCGIHHIKLIIDETGIAAIKAYLYFALSADNK